MATLEQIAAALQSGTPGQALGIGAAQNVVPVNTGGSSPTPSSATPQAIGTATAGTSTDYSRGDHVHAAQLADLSDVSSAAPSSGQVLAWGGSEWAPATPSAGTPSSATPQAIGTATAGTSTDYARGDHVHAAAVTALSDRYVALPLQNRAQFAAVGSRDIQTAIDAHVSGDAGIVLASPGSYPGATVTITTGKFNFALCGATGQPYGGTITSLSGGRALTVTGTATRIRIQNLQIEGLTTWSTSGAGEHRIDRCQLVNGLSVSGFSAGQRLLLTDCEIGGPITIPAGFAGIVLFDHCTFAAGYSFSIGAGVVAAQIIIGQCSGLTAAPSPATVAGFNSFSSGAVGLWASSSQGTTGQVLTSAGAGVAPTWTTPSGITYTDATVNFNTTGGSAPNYTADHQVTGLAASSAYLLDYAEFDNVAGSATQIGLLACTKTQTAGVSVPTTEQQAAILGTFSSPIAVTSLPILDGTTGTYCGPRPGFSGSPVAPAVVTTDSSGRLNLRAYTNANGGSYRVKIRLRKVSP